MDDRSQVLRLGLQGISADEADRVLLFRLVLSISAELRRRLDRRLAEDGLTTQQAMLLHVVEAQASPPRLTQLASQLAMSHQNVKQIASALERKGFLEIHSDPDDSRVRRLQVTAHHRRFWRRRNPADRASVAEWTSALSASDLAAVLRNLDRLHADLMATREES